MVIVAPVEAVVLPGRLPAEAIFTVKNESGRFVIVRFLTQLLDRDTRLNFLTMRL